MPKPDEVCQSQMPRTEALLAAPPMIKHTVVVSDSEEDASLKSVGACHHCPHCNASFNASKVGGAHVSSSPSILRARTRSHWHSLRNLPQTVLEPARAPSSTSRNHRGALPCTMLPTPNLAMSQATTSHAMDRAPGDQLPIFVAPPCGGPHSSPIQARNRTLTLQVSWSCAGFRIEFNSESDCWSPSTVGKGYDDHPTVCAVGELALKEALFTSTYAMAAEGPVSLLALRVSAATAAPERKPANS